VVESDASGGAMITARFAGEQGRLLFAVPGRIDQSTSAGCHQLIRDGATLLTGVEDLMSELSYLDGLRPAPIPEKFDASGERPGLGDLNPSERALLACFAGGGILGPDELVVQTGLPTSVVAAGLMMLELKHRIARRTDGAFEAVQ
jgi:DNA processing protein